MSRAKKSNVYSRNADNSISIQIAENKFVTVDFSDVIKIKLHTVRLVKLNGHEYAVISENIRRENGSWKTLHTLLGKYITGRKGTRYKNGNPFDCRRENLG